MATIRRIGFTLLGAGPAADSVSGASAPHVKIRFKTKGVLLGWRQLPPFTDKLLQTYSSIILVHGLRGHPRETWASESAGKGVAKDRKGLFGRWRSKGDENPVTDATIETGQFWPEDYLSADVPEGRIWTYGYNADVIQDVFQAINKNSVTQHGRDLAIKLERDIENEDPIIFVAHSLGGIVVKAALRRSLECRNRTKLIVFLGTPHRGSDFASWGIIATKLARLALQDSNKRVLEGLQVNGEILDNIHEEFIEVASEHSIRIHSFQESRPVLGITGLHGKVVEDWSSKCDLPRSLEVVESMDANHMQMARSSSKDDPRYEVISAVLRQYIRKHLPAVSANSHARYLGDASLLEVSNSTVSAADVMPSIPTVSANINSRFLRDALSPEDPDATVSAAAMPSTPNLSPRTKARLLTALSQVGTQHDKKDRLVLSFYLGIDFSAVGYMFDTTSKRGIFPIREWPNMHRSKHKTSVPTLIKYWDDRPEWGYSVVHPCGSDAILDEETWSIRNKNPRKAVIDYLTALYMHTLEVMATMAPRAYLGMLDIQCLITVPTLPSRLDRDLLQQAAIAALKPQVTLVKEAEALTACSFDAVGLSPRCDDDILVCQVRARMTSVTAYATVECLPQLKLKEIRPSGFAPSGSNLLEKSLCNALESILGNEEFNRLIKTSSWCTALKTFNDIILPSYDEQDDTMYLQFPNGGLKDNEKMGLFHDTWALDVSWMEMIFQPFIEENIKLLSGTMQNVSTIVLFGDTSSLKYLRLRIQRRFPLLRVLTHVEQSTAFAAAKGAIISQYPEQLARAIDLDDAAGRRPREN